MEKTKPNTTEARIHQSKEMHNTKQTQKNIKPGLVAFCDIQPQRVYSQRKFSTELTLAPVSGEIQLLLTGLHM